MGVWPRMGRLTTAVVVLGLVAGCSASEPTTPAPPTRALVGWSDTLCATVKTVAGVRSAATRMRQGLRSPDPDTAAGEAQMYLSKASQDLGGVLRTLAVVTPSGRPTADGYVAGLLGALNHVRPDLPAPEDVFDLTNADTLARAQRVAGLVDTLQPRLSKLATVARDDPGLVNSYDLAPNCTPVAPVTSAPSRDLVTWADSMCAAVRSTGDLATIPLADLLGRPDYAEFADSSYSNYTSSAAADTQAVRQQITALEPTGDKAADQYRTTLLARLQAVGPKLPQQASDPFDAGTADQIKPQATQASALLTGLLPPGQSLADIIGHDPKLAAANNLAPNCDRPGQAARPALSPRNGTDLGTCRTGTCQVEITGRRQFQVGTTTVTVQVADGWTAILTDISYPISKPGTDATITEPGGATLHIAVIGTTGHTSELDVSTS